MSVPADLGELENLEENSRPSKWITFLLMTPASQVIPGRLVIILNLFSSSIFDKLDSPSWYFLCCQLLLKPAKQLGITFLSPEMDDIHPGDFEVDFLSLIIGEDSLYIIWAELDSKTGNSIWVLLILFLLCLVSPSLQPYLLDKMARGQKKSFESISVAERPLLCNRGRISKKWMTQSILLVDKIKVYICLTQPPANFSEQSWVQLTFAGVLDIPWLPIRLNILRSWKILCSNCDWFAY